MSLTPSNTNLAYLAVTKQTCFHQKVHKLREHLRFFHKGLPRWHSLPPFLIHHQDQREEVCWRGSFSSEVVPEEVLQVATILQCHHQSVRKAGQKEKQLQDLQPATPGFLSGGREGVRRHSPPPLLGNSRLAIKCPPIICRPSFLYFPPHI